MLKNLRGSKSLCTFAPDNGGYQLNCQIFMLILRLVCENRTFFYIGRFFVKKCIKNNHFQAKIKFFLKSC